MSGHLSIKNITLAVLLAASFNLVWQFYWIRRESIERQRTYQQYRVIVCRLGPSRDEASRIYIEFFLIVAFVGTWLKGLKSTLLSVVGLSGASIFYILWWQYVFRIAELSGSEVKSIRHVAYLYGGNYLDLCIAAAIALLVLLHLRGAVLALFRPTSACSELG